MNTEIQVAQMGPSPDGEAAPDGGFGFILPFLAMLLILYALVIRPQQKERNRLKQLQGALAKGDSVVTEGGMYGRVTGVAEDVVTLEIADRVRVKFSRSKVAATVQSGDAPEKPDQKRGRSA